MYLNVERLRNSSVSWMEGFQSMPMVKLTGLSGTSDSDTLSHDSSGLLEPLKVLQDAADDDDDEGLEEFVCLCGLKQESHVCEQQYHLPRSSPVISRRMRLENTHTDKHSHTPTHTHTHSQEMKYTESPVEPLNSSLSTFLVRLLHKAHKTADFRKNRNDGAHAHEEIFRSSAHLDQENAHFVVVDMLLEMMEQVKWDVYVAHKLHTERDHTIGFCETHTPSRDSGYADYSPDLQARVSRVTPVSLSRTSSVPTLLCSAEALAQCLVSEFSQSCPLNNQKIGFHDDFNTTLEDVPSELFSLMMGNGSNLCEEIRQRSRMRGTLIWAPPRFQIIFTLQPTHRRSDVIAAQNFLCAGCGTEIEPKYMKRLRYCDYLGKYFCECCHGGEDAVIPARVLTQWDFGRRPVCLFSKQLLDDIWNEPLFKLTSVAKGIYCQAKELQRFRELQEQLMCLKKLLITCRFAKSVLQEFEQLPSHLTQELDLFSMDDLVRVKRGQLTATARTLFYSGTMHVENCELCMAKGFVCEFCQGPDLLFPFYSDACSRCAGCRACFHRECFRGKECPRCVRIYTRQQMDMNSM